jgi:hypothetical protein
LIEKKSRRNNLKHIYIDSVFCADFKYDVYFKSSEHYSNRKPLKIRQKCQKSDLKNSMIRIWSSGPLFQILKNRRFCRAWKALSNDMKKNWGGNTIKKSYRRKNEKSCFLYILNLLFDVFDLVVHFFGFLKTVSFVEFKKLYRMVYKRNGEKI